MPIEDQLLKQGYKASGPIAPSEIENTLNYIISNNNNVTQLMLVRGTESRNDLVDYPNLWMVYYTSDSSDSEIIDTFDCRILYRKNKQNGSFYMLTANASDGISLLRLKVNTCKLDKDTNQGYVSEEVIIKSLVYKNGIKFFLPEEEKQRYEAIVNKES